MRVATSKKNTSTPSAAAFVLFFVVFFLLATMIATAGTIDQILDEERFSEQDTAAITAVFADAGEMGIPDKLLQPRLSEGLAKNVPARRIAAALQRDIGLLVQARSLLEQTPEGRRVLEDHSRWVRTANLLAGGRSEDDIMRIVQAAGVRPTVYRQLSALYVSLQDWGIEAELAVPLLTAAAESGLEPADFPGITDILAEGRLARLHTPRTVQAMIELLPEIGGIPELRRQILHR